MNEIMFHEEKITAFALHIGKFGSQVLIHENSTRAIKLKQVAALKFCYKTFFIYK